MTILNDNQVSRMVAEKALHDRVFRRQLFNYINLTSWSRSAKAKRKLVQTIVSTIERLRVQLVDQAGLKVPELPSGNTRGLNTYLKTVTSSRVLLKKANTQKEEGTDVTSENGNSEWGWVGEPIDVACLAATFLQSTLRFQADPTPFPFERLPPELRLEVYREALRGVILAEVITVTPTRNNNDKSQFRFWGTLKGRQTKDINVGILTANRQLNNEAIAVLYELRTFDFRTKVGGVEPFLRRLSGQARLTLGGIAMELHNKAEPDHCCGRSTNDIWGKGPDNQSAWTKACAYIAGNIIVKRLSLTINVKIPAEFKSLKWVRDLIKIRKLKHLTLQVDQHYYGSPVTVRASYKEGSLSATDHCVSEHLIPFFEYLREKMLD